MSQLSRAPASPIAGLGGSARVGGVAAVRPPRRRRGALRGIPPLIRLCLLAIALIGLAGLFAPLLAPHDPVAQTLLARLAAPAGFAGGALAHPLGTDQLGRDVLSRVLYGTRVSVGIGVLGMAIGMTLGTTVGMVAGFLRGPVDEALGLVIDANLALPTIVLALTAIAIFGTGLTVLVLVVGIAGWEGYARLARGQVLAAREQPYVLAARALGAPRARILSRHVLPNIAAPLIVLATFHLTGVILLEASLSFLGIGVQPPTPSWGAMVGEGREYLNTAWWIAVVPGAAILITTMAISLLGDWLRDALDPTLRGR